MNIVPVAGAIVSDSYFGCFPVILAGIAITVLSFVLFTLSATLPLIRPPRCAATATPGACQHASPGQLAVLYAAAGLLSLGTGGTRFNVATMGADQFVKDRDQDTFFNWYFVFLYASFLLGDTAIIYLQDSISWAIGFGLCVATTATSLVVLLLGARYFRRPAPRGSPFADLARVVVAAVRKARVDIGALGRVQYHAGDGVVADSPNADAPSKSLRFLNRAAMITASDTSPDGSIGHCSRWRLCTVQQVEDLKSLLGVLPLWSSGIFVSLSIAVMMGLIVLQALAMDRSLGPWFKIPAGSMIVSSFAAFIAATPFLERAVFPLWGRLGVGGRLPTPLQRVGLGHVVNIASMAAAALVERRRLRIVSAHGAEAGEPGWVPTPMSALWLLFPLVAVGVGEALHFPGQMAFYYQEFPRTLRTTATAMAPLVIAMGFYLSTVFVDVVRRVTAWLPRNINQGRVDNVYWALAVAGTINFGYFLVCVRQYKYQNRSISS